MKMIVCPDSFKGSLSSLEAAEAIREGILSAKPDAEVVCIPIADGGEGTLDALVSQGKRIRLRVTGPDGSKVDAEYGYEGDTAIIEMARAAGLVMLSEDKRSAGASTTYGVGELMRDALCRGYRKIMLTVGGSATNDGGCGMLAALGAKFTNQNGEVFVPVGRTLSDIAKIDISDVPSELLESEIVIATDVKNPLLGKNGATYVYGPQKGATASELEELELGMQHYAQTLAQTCGKRVDMIEGSGAGGGIGAPLLAFFGARISSGIEAVLDAVGFSEKLFGADALITGEGRLDSQSLCGKAISGVAKRAENAKLPMYCLVGCVEGDSEALKKMGIRDIFSITDVALSVDDAIINARKYLREISSKLSMTL